MKNKAFVLSLIFISGIIVILLVIQQQQSSRTSPVTLSSLKSELFDTSNNKLTLSELKGSVVFINFWASWCQTCKDEMPSIERLHKYFSGNPQFILLTVLYRDNIEKAFIYMKKSGYTFPLYHNPDGAVVKQFGITGVPETFIFDKNGILKKKVVGPLEWDSPQIIETLNNFLNAPE